MNRSNRLAAFFPLLLPAAVCTLLLICSIPSLLIAKKVIGFLALPSGLA